MLHVLAPLDRSVASSRPLWGWIGQLAVVALGVHLAADRLDDLLAGALAALPVAWPDPEAPLAVATWAAIAVELLVVGWAGLVLLSATAEPADTARAWLQRVSVAGILAPALFLTTGLAGSWVVQMAVEDLTAGFLLDLATPLGWLLAALVGWRLVAPGFLRVLRRQRPSRRTAGLLPAPIVLLVVVLAVQHGLPVWGWLR